MVDFKKLDNIEPNSALDALAKGPLTDLQRALSFIGGSVGTIDGQFGPKTRNAWAEFIHDTHSGDPTTISETGLERLKERIDSMNGVLEQSLSNAAQVKTAIAAACEEMGIGRKQQIAYVLATAEWETNHTFEPVKEAYWLSESWRKKNLHYYPFYGRGYVQLTWKRNYEKYGDILDLGLADKPDLALDSRAALFVLVHGFKTGTFTERKISEFINAELTDYRNARRCINGVDKWSEIQALAEHYEDSL